MVISHAAPACVQLPPALNELASDPSRAALDWVLLRYKPRWWFCGHYHLPFGANPDACAFRALDCAVDEWDRAQQAGLALLRIARPG
jgi:hypothetical protein